MISTTRTRMIPVTNEPRLRVRPRRSGPQSRRRSHREIATATSTYRAYDTRFIRGSRFRHCTHVSAPSGISPPVPFMRPIDLTRPTDECSPTCPRGTSRRGRRRIDTVRCDHRLCSVATGTLARCGAPRTPGGTELVGARERRAGVTHQPISSKGSARTIRPRSFSYVSTMAATSVSSSPG